MDAIRLPLATRLMTAGGATFWCVAVIGAAIGLGRAFPGASLALFGLAGAVCLGLLAHATATLAWRVRVTPDRIERIGLFGERTVPRSAIVGFHNTREGLSLSAHGGDLTLPGKALALAPVRTWLEGLTDLGAQEELGRRDVLLQEEARGEAPAGRLAMLDRLRRPVQLANTLLAVLGVGLVIFSDLSWSLLAAGLAISLLAGLAGRRWPSYLSVMPADGSLLLNLGGAWGMPPAIFLATQVARVVRDDWNLAPLAPAALAAALAFGALTLWGNRNVRQPFNAIGAAFVAGGWGLGLAALLLHRPGEYALGL